MPKIRRLLGLALAAAAALPSASASARPNPCIEFPEICAELGISFCEGDAGLDIHYRGGLEIAPDTWVPSWSVAYAWSSYCPAGDVVYCDVLFGNAVEIYEVVYDEDADGRCGGSRAWGGRFITGEVAKVEVIVHRGNPNFPHDRVTCEALVGGPPESYNCVHS